jgi:hypothetical protein
MSTTPKLKNGLLRRARCSFCPVTIEIAQHHGFVRQAPRLSGRDRQVRKPPSNSPLDALTMQQVLQRWRVYGPNYNLRGPDVPGPHRRRVFVMRLLQEKPELRRRQGG